MKRGIGLTGASTSMRCIPILTQVIRCDSDELKHYYSRHTVFEFLVHRLVMPNLYTKQCAEAATNYS
jgi:hypothetical protein